MKINDNSASLNQFATFAQEAVLRGDEKAVIRVNCGERMEVSSVRTSRPGDATYDRPYAALTRTIDAKQSNALARSIFFREIANLFENQKIPPSVQQVMSGFKKGGDTPLTARRIITVLNEVQMLRSMNTPPPKAVVPQPPKAVTAPSPKAVTPQPSMRKLRPTEVNCLGIDQTGDASLTGAAFVRRVKNVAARLTSRDADRFSVKNEESFVTRCRYYEDNTQSVYAFRQHGQDGGGHNNCFFLSALSHMGITPSNANAFALRQVLRESLLELKRQIAEGRSAVERTDDGNYRIKGTTQYISKLLEGGPDGELERTLDPMSDAQADLSIGALLAHHLQRPITIFTTGPGSTTDGTFFTFDRDVFSGTVFTQPPAHIYFSKAGEFGHFEALDPVVDNFRTKLPPIDIKKPFTALLPENVDKPIGDFCFHRFKHVLDSVLLGVARRRLEQGLLMLDWLRQPEQTQRLRNLKEGLELLVVAYRLDLEEAERLPEGEARAAGRKAAEDGFDAQLERFFKALIADAGSCQPVDRVHFVSGFPPRPAS